ncbi:hypothetical protein GCM10023155_01050 [Bremerella cremea]
MSGCVSHVGGGVLPEKHPLGYPLPIANLLWGSLEYAFRPISREWSVGMFCPSGAKQSAALYRPTQLYFDP